VANLIRGKSVDQAQTILRFANKGGTTPLLKLLNSAVASGVHNFQLDPANLYIAKLLVDEGPKLKRVYPRARGRADQIQKKTSHVTLVLDEKVKGQVAKIQRPTVGEKEKLSFPRKLSFNRPEKEIVKVAETKRQFRMFRRKAI
jgi:large subunit ribosomal protein L22